ncbi:MAG: hypothetical protein JO311_03560 [Candidatus Eremiobacteraeota bacterium]|nr:hypothetical protein [Candidatus Eremiobacteraeota bacterium]MBV9263424.1 hypothetical protein [Candidatus Eremiobacteraeota bacterium]
MHFSRFAIALLLAGCGAATNAALPGVPSNDASAYQATGLSGALRHAAPLLYVGSVGGTIDTFTLVKGQYQKTGQLQDSNGPEGLHTDALANLYVADQGIGTEGPGVGDIAVYPKGASQPSRFIVPGYNVSDVIAVKNGAHLYASNFGPDGQFGPGSMSFYGATGDAPLRTTTIPSSFQAISLVRDSSTKDVFVSYSDNSGNGRIARFRHGRGRAHDLGVTFGTPWGIAEDRSRNLLVADGNGPIHVYSQKGKLLANITVPGTAYRMAFNADYTLLYVTNFGNFDVEIFTYPAGKMVGTIHAPEWNKSAWTDGIAVWPPPQ